MTERISTVNHSILKLNCTTLAALSCALALIAARVHGGETCPTNDNGPDICVSKEGAAPQEFQDFLVNYTTDPANPSVLLRTGNSTWNVRSDDAGSPGNLGHILIDFTLPSDNFGVSINGPGGPGPGAVNVISISLNDSDPLWTGHSDFTGGHITGDLTGSLLVVEDAGGAGGAITGDFTVDGTVLGNITAPAAFAKVLTVGGALDGDVTLGDLSGTIYIGGVTTGTMTVGAVAAGAIITTGGVSGEIHALGDVAGAIESDGDVTATGAITIDGELSATGNVRLNHSGLYGNITVKDAGAGSINLIHILDANASIVLGDDASDVFSGSLGIGFVTYSPVEGTITIENLDGLCGLAWFAGALDIRGRLGRNAMITHWATMSGSIDINSDLRPDTHALGDILLTGVSVGPEAELSGTVHVHEPQTGGGGGPSGDFGGLFRIHQGIGITETGSLTIDGNMNGTIDVFGPVLGPITIGKDLSGDISIGLAIGDDLGAPLSVQGNAEGDITIGGTLEALIGVTGDLSGDIEVGSFGSLGSIHVYGRLTSTGSIDTGDESPCMGNVLIYQDTAVSSRIVMTEGIGATGGITINYSEGDYHAHGSIQIGQTPCRGICSLDGPVTFDGFIAINDENGGPGGGNLEGSISVVGCHADTAPLDICICGENNGTLWIQQSGCANQVDVLCQSHCQ